MQEEVSFAERVNGSSGMHPEGWKPLVRTVTSPVNIVLTAIGIALAVDYVLGSPVMSRLVDVQLRVMGINPASGNMRLYTVFGTFTRVYVWTRFLERALIVIFFVVPGLSWVGGFITSVRGN